MISIFILNVDTLVNSFFAIKKKEDNFLNTSLARIESHAVEFNLKIYVPCRHHAPLEISLNSWFFKRKFETIIPLKCLKIKLNSLSTLLSHDFLPSDFSTFLRYSIYNFLRITEITSVAIS